MSNFGGAKATAEELGVSSLQELQILLAAGQITLDSIILVGDQFITDSDGELVRVEE